MTTDHTNLVSGTNLSVVWAKTLMSLMGSRTGEISPLLVSLQFPMQGILEIPKIRKGLDAFLKMKNEFSCHTIANTIFPESQWNPTSPRNELFNRYRRILPKLKKYPQNRNGIYFERMIAFNGNTNQLEHLIQTYNSGNHRRSALQTSIFDPTKDHTHQRQRGFPCLQHVFFTPSGTDLTVTGVYATQSIDIKGYGNFLGLSLLGIFMAHELGLHLTSMNCIANVAKIESSKRALLLLAKMIERYLEE